MQNIVTFLTLDVYDYDLSPSTIKAIALDSNTRSVTAYITKNGQPYDVGQSNVTLTVIRPDGVGAQVTGEAFEYEASVEDTTVTRHGAYAELSPATLAKKGTLRAQFMFTSGNQVLRTEIFTISCGEALDASTDTWAGEYQGYNLDELVQNVNESSAKVDAMEEDVSDLKEGLSDIQTATASDVGKALKVKTVTDGKVTEWEFGEAGGGDISAFTDSIPEYLKASDATDHQWYKDATGATQTTSSINACTFGVVIPIEAGKTYYYKDIIGGKSWYRYTGGTTGRIVNTTNNNLYSGTFTATADGTVICSGLTANASTAIWTEDEDIYNAGLQEDKTILKTDSTLTSAELPANAKAVGDALEGFDADINAVNAIVGGVDNEFFDSSFGLCSINTTNHVITKSPTGNLYGSGFFRIIPYVTYESNALWSNQWCYVYDKDGNYVCSLSNDGNDAVYTQHINTKKSTFCVTNPDAYTIILVMSASSASGYTDISIRALSESESMSMLDVNAVSALKHRLCSVSPYMYGKKWAVLGDSITAGDGLTSNILTRYSTLIEKQCGIIAYNYGYSGSRIAVQGSEGDATYDNAMVIRYANMIDDADYITVLGGINDANNQLPLGTLGDTDISTFYGALEVLITGLLTKYPGKAIGFITYPHYQSSERHQTYVNAIKEACARYAIPVLDLHSNGGMNTMTTAFSQMFYSDGLHPNELGQSVMARKICAFLGTL